MNENLKQAKEVLDILQREYDKGYTDGYSEREREIVRCKDCKFYLLNCISNPQNFKGEAYCLLGGMYGSLKDDYDFCSKGEKQYYSKAFTKVN